MQQNGKWRVMVPILIFVLIASPVFASDAIKQRMLQRLPVIADLKTRGVIGEDNRGYLGYVGGVRESEDVIEAENKDRKTVYEAFARQQNTSLDVVEQVQAARKAERANPGEFYQTPQGRWVQK